LIGAGNLWVGSQRSAFYLTLRNDLVQSSDKTSALSSSALSSYGIDTEIDDELLLGSLEPGEPVVTLRIDQKVSDSPLAASPQRRTGGRSLEYVEARYNFYRFCVLGGKCLLAASGAFLFLWILMVARSEEPEIPNLDDTTE